MKQEQTLSKKEVKKRESFLTEFRELSEKHGLDFGIYYEFDQMRGMVARFAVIEKTNVQAPQA